MTVILISIAVVALSVFLLCFNIIFRNKPFPNGDVGANPELRKRGLQCATGEEMKLWGKKGHHNHQCTGECGEVIKKIQEDFIKKENEK